jgi:hypothetical protein
LDILEYFGGVLCWWRSTGGIPGRWPSRIQTRIWGPSRHVVLIVVGRHCFRSPNHSRVIRMDCGIFDMGLCEFG